ncbi:MAG: glycosyltransferase [Rubrobacter sp.]|nr:glycosyltransferase [Rubrobacter sp.]
MMENESVWPEIGSIRQELRRELQRVNRQLSDKDSELAEKSRQLSELDRRLARKSKQLAQKSQEVERLTLWFEELRAGVTALLNSRQWRAGRAVGELHRRLLLRPRVPTALDYVDTVTEKFRFWRRSYERSEGRPVGDDESSSDGPSMSSEELAREIRGSIGPAPQRVEWPPVSIVVLNRNGLGHLGRLFPGLRDRTDYPDFEVVLVDNGSTDGSVEFVKSFETEFPVRLIENPGNTLFSTGNGQGAAAAKSELLLFLNNDIEPFEPGWLKELVECMESSRSIAAGALLLYPGGDDHRTSSGYATQHRGIKFRRDLSLGVVRAFNLGNDDALGEHLGVDASCPAATAACLLIGREAFEAVGGFTETYRYGQEDVDLGLKLSASGREVVSSGRAVLFHHEFGTQNVEGRDFMRINRMGNWRLLLERWGPQLHRELLFDRLDRAKFWSEGPVHMAITVAADDASDDRYAAHELGDALISRGWRVTYIEHREWYSLPEGTDYLLVLLDSYDVSRVFGVTTIAWVWDRPDRWVRQPWFEEFDVVLAASGASACAIERSTDKTTHLFPLATNPERFARTPPNPAYEADYVFAGDYEDAPSNLVDHLNVAPGETFMVFGEGWEEVPRLTRYARGHLPHDQLPQIYSSTGLLLDAADRSTLPHEAFGSRVFDALAAGTLVVTNNQASARELFDEDFPTYGTRDELRENLDVLLGDEARRAELVGRYREVVLREHTYERRAEQFAVLLRERAEALSFCIKVDAPGWDVARFYDDLVRARAVRRQLERCGHPCIIQVLDEWDDFEGLKYDIVVHLKGSAPYVPKPSQLNVLWDTGRPEPLTARECDRYDLVFVASERWAARLGSRTSTPVVVLEPATDPEVLFPDLDPIHQCELVFVGDSHEVGRKLLGDLLPTDCDLAVWGGGWEGLIDDKYIVGRWLPNDQLRKAYSSASIVLVADQDYAREYDFVPDQLYDALACGALVISDGSPELNERFGDAVVTYDSPGELRRRIEYCLGCPEEREEKGRRGRELVLARHTFEHRVEELLRRVEGLVEEGGFRTRVRPLARAT